MQFKRNQKVKITYESDECHVVILQDESTPGIYIPMYLNNNMKYNINISGHKNFDGTIKFSVEILF